MSAKGEHGLFKINSSPHTVITDDTEKSVGSEILIKSLIEEGVHTIFGYPGGTVVNIYETLYDYQDKLKHILVRHEQGAVHAAQGFARATGEPGVVLVTSGPGATNVTTGVADAMIDSTPIVVISGQVSNNLLGTDAFQETDVIALTNSIAKWCYQIRRAEDITWAVARAFYIAKNGRPGPVVLDITKDAQRGFASFSYKKCTSIRTYNPYPKPSEEDIDRAVNMINAAERPLLVFGQGITLAGAEKELAAFVNKSSIPAASTLLGLSALSSSNKHYVGMVGMHGNIAPNVMTQSCDLLIAIGMRFDDRVTGLTSTYAKQAKIIHIDIDPVEIGKNVPVTLGILGDAKEVLPKLTSAIEARDYTQWKEVASGCFKVEEDKSIKLETEPQSGYIHMGEVISGIASQSKGNAIIVTDVGQNQMAAARYSKFVKGRSMITSGGLGTMGFGLPAAIGAKTGRPDRTVCLLVGDGGLQMTIQELGTIMQEGTGVKIILLNNNWLGNVRQWQELFFNKRYSSTKMLNPDYISIALAYGIRSRTVDSRDELKDAIADMLSDDKPFLLEVRVEEEGLIFPMIPSGKSVNQIMLNSKEWYENGK